MLRKREIYIFELVGGKFKMKHVHTAKKSQLWVQSKRPRARSTEKTYVHIYRTFCILVPVIPVTLFHYRKQLENGKDVTFPYFTKMIYQVQ